MKILTIQSDEFYLETLKNDIIYPDSSRCNHENAKEVYKHLFDDYNQKKSTSYHSFFWGFSKLLANNLEQAIERACEMIGLDSGKVFILDIPKEYEEICLETDFYNFSDEIYAYMYPNELESIWESIYEERNSEKQVIIPYIKSSWIVKIVDL